MDKAISKPLRIEVVRHVVKVWSVTFPGSRSDDEKEIITSRFFDALSSLFSEPEFLDAARAVEKQVEFFPVVKHFLDVRDQVFAARQRHSRTSQLTLPEGTDNLTPEEIEQSRRKVEIIRDMLSGKLSIDEAERMQSELVTFSAKG